MPKVLIIDDEIEISEVLKDYFTEEGFEALCCFDGAQGLVEFARFHPDLIILDIMLPYIEGTDILRSIRNKSDVPIMMLSAKKTERDKIQSLGLGADEYIEKPFSPKVLVAQAKALLRRCGKPVEQNSLSEALKIKNVEIEEKSRQVKVEGGIISLAPKEFDLLLFLAKNPNRVFTKDHLLDSIWGSDEFIDPNTVTVHIRKIREKIEKNPAEPLILKTVWGVGYQLIKS
jgi:two-component system, OmpR family, response regulator VicR